MRLPAASTACGRVASPLAEEPPCSCKLPFLNPGLRGQLCLSGDLAADRRAAAVHACQQHGAVASVCFPWQRQGPRQDPSPSARQLFCRSCGCSFLAGLENNEFSIKPPSPSSVPGGTWLQLHCAAIQDRKQKPARPKGSTGGIRGDKKQLNTLAFGQDLGVVTPCPTAH